MTSDVHSFLCKQRNKELDPKHAKFAQWQTEQWDKIDKGTRLRKKLHEAQDNLESWRGRKHLEVFCRCHADGRLYTLETTDTLLRAIESQLLESLTRAEKAFNDYIEETLC